MVKEGHTAFLPEEIEWYDKLLATGLEDNWRKLNLIQQMLLV